MWVVERGSLNGESAILQVIGLVSNLLYLLMEVFQSWSYIKDDYNVDDDDGVADGTDLWDDASAGEPLHPRPMQGDGR